MTRKQWLQLTSLLSSLLVPVGLVLWIRALADYQASWSEQEAAIGRAWTIIPLALVVAIGSGILAARIPNPDGTKDRASRWLAAIALLFAIGIVVMLLNIRIG